MTAFFYWLPSDAPSTNTARLLERMRAAGLGYAVEDRITHRGSERGPDAMRGHVICHGANTDGTLGYWENEQRWKKVHGTDIWCGMFNDQRPTPDELARGDQIAGEWLLLEDGHRWLIPQARRFVESNGSLAVSLLLPQRLTLNDAGQWVTGNVKPRYARLWQLASDYGDAWAHGVSRQDNDETISFEIADAQLLDTAVAALQTNYRVGTVELDLLGVFDDQTAANILRILIDSQTYWTWVKKKAIELAAAGGNS